MTDDGFDAFSDDDFSEQGKEEEDIETNDDTDFFGNGNKGYRETTLESPFEIPYSNMRDLGKRKPKVVIEDETIHVPDRDNDVNIGLPEGSDTGSPRNESVDENEEKDQGAGGGLSDLLKSLKRRGQEDTDSPQNELARDAVRAEVREIAPSRKTKTAQEDYEERMAKYGGGGVAINGILEEDEFGHDDPLELLGFGSDKKKKKKKSKVQESKGVLPKVNSYSIGVDKAVGLTSAVQAQAAAAQKEKEKKELLFVTLSNIGSSSSKCSKANQRR